MRSRQRVERVLVRVGKATPVSVRGPLGRATRAVRGRWQGPRVTVVVAVSDTETRRVAPCLMSIRAQTHRNLDVLVVPYGRATGALAAAREQAAEDWRIRIQQPAADRAAAWNAGAARARPGYLVFVRGGDDVPTHAIERLATCLEESGSQMAVGRIEPPLTLNASVDSPYDAAHQTEIRATTLADTPVAITDLGVGNRMIRTSFWAEAGLRFDPADRLGTELALASYVQARSFDLVTDPAYIPTGRQEGVSVGAMRDVLSELDRWLVEHAATQRSVSALGLPDVLDWWLWGTLDAAIQPFLGDVERATPDQWDRLRTLVEELVESGGESAWASLRADSRVKLWLVRGGHRDALEEYVAARLFERSHRPTEVRDGTILAHLPFFADPALAIPDSVFEMHEAETRLWANLYRIQWVTPQRLELRGFARIEHVDLGEDTEVSAWLVERGSGQRTPLAVDRYVDERANIFEGSRYQDYAPGAVTIAVDTTVLADRARELRREVRWTIQLEVTTRGVTRRGGLAEIDDRASAGMIETGHLGDRRLGDVRVGVRGRTASRFALVAAPTDGPQLIGATVTHSAVRLRLQTATPVTEVRAVDNLGAVARARCTLDGGSATASLEVPRPRPGDPPRRLRLLAVAANGAEQGVAWPADAPQWLEVGAGEIALSRSESGEVDLVDAVGTLVAEDVTLGPDGIDVQARWLGTSPRRWAVQMVHRKGSFEGQVVDSQDPLRLRFPIRWDEWGLGDTAIPVGGYRFRLDLGTPGRPVEGRVLVGEGLLDRLLDFTVTEQFRMRPSRGGREAGLVLLPPLTDADRGQLAQARLQEWYRRCDLPIDQQAAYLQSYTGMSATDSQLALHQELRRRRPDLTIHWGVVDSSSVVPEGGVPVLMHSREWYRVMATARYLCLNIDPDRWFSLRPGQEMLQTFHGYPAKSMGIRMWEGKGYTPRRIDLELDRTSRDWSMILTPAPEMDEHYRREYRYDGPIHSEGYPRDDLLVSAEAGTVREDTRRRLGIAPHQKAVLYAPTWRDDLATNWRRADVVHHLDVVAASRRLGPDYVLLMRGHRFHGPAAPEQDGGAQLLDVTDYPEINHLILAADAAVLDYSSLRFDFALTRRPMVFLVPDLAAYTGGVRGFLYPFEESAPGPLVDTAEEVITRLRDLAGLEREYAAALAAFHDRYNYLQDGRSAEKVVSAFFGSERA